MRPTLSFALMVCLLATSCRRTENCPAFDSTVLDAWFVYSAGDTFYFTDNAGATDTLMIRKVKKTGAYTISWQDWRGEHDECNVFGEIASRVDSDHPRWLQLNIFQSAHSAGTDEVNIHVLRCRVDVKADLAMQTLIDTSRHKISQLESITSRGITYHDVRLIEPATGVVAANEQVDKLYLAKGKGIIGYRTYPAGEEYWLK